MSAYEFRCCLLLFALVRFAHSINVAAVVVPESVANGIVG